MAAACAGPPFWDSLLGAGKDGQYPEYVSPDIFLGEYVAKLEQDQSSDALTKSDTPEADSPPAQKLPRWKRRTPEQIEANKAAQKRFRQRKKAKLQSVSQNVEELTQQMQDMEGLKAGVKSMEERKAVLEGDLWAKEAEIEQIKFEMLNPRTPQAVYDDKAQGKCFSSPPPLDKKVEQTELRWKQAKDKLDKVLKGSDLQPQRKPELSTKQVGSLEKSSLEMIAQCMAVLSLGGPQLDDLLRTLADRQEDLLRQGEIAKYGELAEFLCLTPQQTQDVISLRASVMQRLETIYTTRQGLNHDVMTQLMDAPQAPEEAAVPASAAERAGKLREKLNLLLANLKEEQRLESEHHWAIMRKILTPLQGAWFISKAYPAHCDTLAFMHGVHNLSNRAAAGSS